MRQSWMPKDFGTSGKAAMKTSRSSSMCSSLVEKWPSLLLGSFGMSGLFSLLVGVGVVADDDVVVVVVVLQQTPLVLGPVKFEGRYLGR